MTSVRAASTSRSALALARGLRGEIVTAWIPAPARTASNAPVILPGPVEGQKPEVRCVLAEVHRGAADLLGSPRAVGACGDAGDVHGRAVGHDDVPPADQPGRRPIEDRLRGLASQQRAA